MWLGTSLGVKKEMGLTYENYNPFNEESESKE